MLAKALSWAFALESHPDQYQALYHFEAPQHSFKTRDIQEDDTSIHEADPEATWSNISLELPTRPLEHVGQWLHDGGHMNLSVICCNDDGQLIRKWVIHDGCVIHKNVARGLRTVNKVMRLIVKYKWACRLK